MKTIRSRRTITQPVPDDPRASFTLVVGATGEVAECNSIVPLLGIAAQALADGHSVVFYPPGNDTLTVRPGDKLAARVDPVVEGYQRGVSVRGST